MRFEPILRARINAFRTNYGYSSLKDSDAYEMFVNYSIVEMHQPDAINNNLSLLNAVSVGGSDDMGIDGIGIKINGIFVTTPKEVDAIVELQKRITIEFVFIQSKFKDKLESAEFAKFTDGILDFLNDEHFEPHNEKIEDILQVKNRIFDDDIILRWNSSPTVRVYYAIFGEWRDATHINGKAQRLIEDIKRLGSYEEATVTYVDNILLKKVCEENEHAFSTVISVIGSFELTETPGVKNSLMVLCSAKELIQVLSTDEGLMRKSLFTDNVRDYQGNTTINNEILDTITNAPANFSLLNNGITIVCTSILPSNRKVSLVNPQIVNGCQTCHVLFDAYKQGANLTDVSFVAKIIATDKDDITNSIVRGTNSQNVVYSEAFETTREFHKNLEEFFNVIQENNQSEKIYYERRSRQYVHDASVLPLQTAGLKTLVQSFVSIFLQAPHNGAMHEAALLKKYQNVIFVDGQSFFPYFVSALMCLRFERSIRAGRLENNHQSDKFHILLLTSEMIAGIAPGINDAKRIDQYSRKLLDTILDVELFIHYVEQSAAKYNEVMKSWIKTQGSKFRHGIKDNPNFTKYLLMYIRGAKMKEFTSAEEDSPTYRGKVVKARRDRNGYYFGFIQKSPEDIFFHERDNAKLDFEQIYGQTVIYKTFSDSLNGEERAQIMDVLIDQPYKI